METEISYLRARYQCLRLVHYNTYNVAPLSIIEQLCERIEALEDKLEKQRKYVEQLEWDVNVGVDEV